MESRSGWVTSAPAFFSYGYIYHETARISMSENSEKIVNENIMHLLQIEEKTQSTIYRVSMLIIRQARQK